jgi:Orsellinic acid/F9775 biosynthesis cluster protein D
MVRKILMCGALMERYLRYNDEFHLAICQACRVGLPANNVLRHIRMHHSSTWTLHKKLLKTYVKALNLISLEELATIQPDGIRDPIPGINVTSGWCCDGDDNCMVAGASEKYLRQHAQKVHGWTAQKEKCWFACELQTLLGHPYIK